MQQQQDEQMLRFFHLMDAEERDFYLEVFKLRTEGRISKTPTLTLIRGGSLTGGAPSRNFG